MGFLRVFLTWYGEGIDCVMDGVIAVGEFAEEHPVGHIAGGERSHERYGGMVECKNDCHCTGRHRRTGKYGYNRRCH